jgi:hypothetical protein
MNDVVTMSGTVHDNKTRWSHKEGLDCQEGDALIVCGYVAATGMPQSTLEHKNASSSWQYSVLSTAENHRDRVNPTGSPSPQRGAG